MGGREEGKTGKIGKQRGRQAGRQTDRQTLSMPLYEIIRGLIRINSLRSVKWFNGLSHLLRSPTVVLIPGPVG